MTKPREGDTFTHNGETYVWGRPVGPTDVGVVPTPPPGLVESWGTAEAAWEVVAAETGEPT